MSPPSTTSKLFPSPPRPLLSSLRRTSCVRETCSNANAGASKGRALPAQFFVTPHQQRREQRYRAQMHAHAHAQAQQQAHVPGHAHSQAHTQAQAQVRSRHSSRLRRMSYPGLDATYKQHYKRFSLSSPSLSTTSHSPSVASPSLAPPTAQPTAPSPASVPGSGSGTVPAPVPHTHHPSSDPHQDQVCDRSSRGSVDLLAAVASAQLSPCPQQDAASPLPGSTPSSDPHGSTSPCTTDSVPPLMADVTGSPLDPGLPTPTTGLPELPALHTLSSSVELEPQADMKCEPARPLPKVTGPPHWYAHPDPTLSSCGQAYAAGYGSAPPPPPPPPHVSYGHHTSTPYGPVPPPSALPPGPSAPPGTIGRPYHPYFNPYTAVPSYPGSPPEPYSFHTRMNAPRSFPVLEPHRHQVYAMGSMRTPPPGRHDLYPTPWAPVGYTGTPLKPMMDRPRGADHHLRGASARHFYPPPFPPSVY